MSSKLRIGLLLDSLELKAWHYAMLKKIAGSDYAELALAIRIEGEERAPGSATQLLSDAYAFLDLRFRCEPDALAAVDGTDLLGRLPVLPALVRCGHLHELMPQVLSQLRDYRLDVMVNLSGTALSGDLVSAVACGVWDIFFGDERLGYGNPPGFWEVHFGCPITVSGVRITTEHDKESRTLLCRSFSGTNPLSLRLTNNNVYWKNATLLPRKLEQLRRLGKREFLESVERQSDDVASCDHAPQGQPTAARMVLHIAETVKRQVTDLTVRALTKRPWILLFNFGDDVSMRIGDFTKLVAPRDRYWADPFVIAQGGKYYVFIEEVMNATGKGHISVLVMDRQGKYEGPFTVLQRDYHLSYPFVFEHEGSLYMVPESSDNRTVELHKCIEFPTRWEFVMNLLEDIYAVDSTLLCQDGTWWLFANVVEHSGASAWEDLFLFHSDSLLGGRWRSHPSNPIVSDVRRSRPAGAIYRKEARLYRPSQDCSVRYGYAIRVNEITKLSEDDYAETEVASITPSSDMRIVATHTLNHAGGLTVIDAIEPQLRI